MVWILKNLGSWLRQSGPNLEQLADAVITKVLGLNETQRLAAANVIWLQWQIFNVKFGSAEVFMAAPDAVKAEFLTKHGQLVVHVHNQEQIGEAPKGTAAGIALVDTYFRCLAAGNTRLANHLVDHLEPLNRLGHEFRTYAAAVKARGRADDA